MIKKCGIFALALMATTSSYSMHRFARVLRGKVPTMAAAAVTYSGGLDGWVVPQKEVEDEELDLATDMGRVLLKRRELARAALQTSNAELAQAVHLMPNRTVNEKAVETISQLLAYDPDFRKVSVIVYPCRFTTLFGYPSIKYVIICRPDIAKKGPEVDALTYVIGTEAALKKIVTPLVYSYEEKRIKDKSGESVSEHFLKLLVDRGLGYDVVCPTDAPIVYVTAYR